MTTLQTLKTLSGFSLAKLRKHQTLNKIQMKTAFEKRDTPALVRLQTMETAYTEAIMVKEFNACAQCFAGVVHTHKGNGVN